MFLKSRRSFLKGRVPQRTTWQQFCEHVTKQMPNRLQLLSGVDTYLTTDAKLKKTQARFVPKNAQDVYAVFYLAEQFGITLGLYDEQWAQFYKVPALVWLDPSELNRCQFLTHGTRVYIEPGCTMHQLVSLGLDQFAALPGSMRFIDWLSEPGYFQQRSLNDSGVQMVSMVQADRSIARLGPFGKHLIMGLNTPTL